MRWARLVGVGGVLGGSAGYAGYNQYWKRRSENALVVPSDFNQNQADKIGKLFATLGPTVESAQVGFPDFGIEPMNQSVVFAGGPSTERSGLVSIFDMPILVQSDILRFSDWVFKQRYQVRTFLDVHGVRYQTVEVDPFTKAEIKNLEYRKVPQVMGSSPESIYHVSIFDIAHITGQ